MLRLAFLSLLAVSLPAQIITATLTGAVHDPQGAAVPTAALTVTSVETAQTRARDQRLRGPLQRPVSRARNLLALSHREGLHRPAWWRFCESGITASYSDRRALTTVAVRRERDGAWP